MENRVNLKKGIVAILIGAFIIFSLQMAYNIMAKYNAAIRESYYIFLIFQIMGSVKAVVISVISVVFGPIAGLILGLVDRLVFFTGRPYYAYYVDGMAYSFSMVVHGRNLISLQSLSFLLYGISIGALWKYFDFLNTTIKARSMIVFIACQTFASFFFRLFLPNFFDGVQRGRISFLRIFYDLYFLRDLKFIALIVVLSAITLYLFIKIINPEANAKGAQTAAGFFKPTVILNIIRVFALAIIVLFFTLPIGYLPILKFKEKYTLWQIVRIASDGGGLLSVFAFASLIAPVALLIFSFISKYTSKLRYILLIGTIIYIVNIILLYVNEFKLLGFTWIILAIYVVLCGFTFYRSRCSA